MRVEKGFTLIELLLVVAIIGILAALAVPGLLRARLAANETSAIGSIRTINSSESTYASSCARGNYAVNLSDLVLPPAGSASGFLSPDLNTNGVLKSGYVFDVGVGTIAAPTVPGASTCNASVNAATPTFFSEAHPATIGVVGQRSFGSDQRNTIYADNSGATWTAATVQAAPQNQSIQ